MSRYVMYTGISLTSEIYFDNDKKSIYGYRDFPSYPSNGSLLIDLCHNINNKEIPVYLVDNVRFGNDNNDDMFFADIKLITNIPNTYKHDGDVNWFIESARKYNKIVENKWKSKSLIYRILNRKKKPIMFPKALFEKK